MKLKTVFLALSLASALPVLAQDESLPELSGVVPLSELVRQGVITQAQADQIRGSAVGIEPRVTSKKHVQKITISGYGQFAFAYATGHDDALPNPPANSEFYLPNMIFGVSADIGSGFSTTIMANLGAGFSSRNYIEKAYVEKEFEGYGNVQAGFKKAHFGFEQYTSSRYLPAPNRSIATSYFTSSFNRIGSGVYGTSPAGLGTTRLGLGARRLGVYWAGEIPKIDGFEYFAEITQGYQNFSAPSNTGSQNHMGYSGGIQYTHDLDDGMLKVGVNGTYMPEGNSFSAGGLSQSNSIGAVNPFAEVKYEGFHFIGEFFVANVENGKASYLNGPTSITGFNSGDATPFGGTFYATYLFGDIEPVFRFSMIDSNEAGLNPSVVTRGVAFGGASPGAAPGTAVLSSSGVGFFNAAQSYYFGVNWYFLGDDAKIGAGYEFVQFGGRWMATSFGGPDASEGIFRVAAQVVF
ncbi:porin [Cerasicoccus fimbriatus]|uniref:porin n=1 Tax=Cerasicoccus fimbriatus TaxID=3014554 RepID=UPI0022B59BD7|nr:porin [Cerasicoccus sp. TK19100]